MNLLEELTNQLEDAKADYEAKLATAPDIRAAEAEIAIFRTEHAELKHRREAEFAAIQRAARELADAKAEVIRATRALARQEVTSACADRRAAKEKEKADEDARQERVAEWHAAEVHAARARIAAEQAQGITDGWEERK